MAIERAAPPIRARLELAAKSEQAPGTMVRTLVLSCRDGLLRQDMSGYGEIECGRRSLLDLATRRFLRWIERLLGICVANFRLFQLPNSNLLKSAMICPCVAIPVHFR